MFTHIFDMLHYFDWNKCFLISRTEDWYICGSLLLLFLVDNANHFTHFWILALIIQQYIYQWVTLLCYWIQNIYNTRDQIESCLLGSGSSTSQIDEYSYYMCEIFVGCARISTANQIFIYTIWLWDKTNYRFCFVKSDISNSVLGKRLKTHKTYHNSNNNEKSNII